MAKRNVYRDCTVDVPDEWVDSSIYCFKAPAAVVDDDLPLLVDVQGFHPNVVVTREKSTGVALAEFVEAQIAISSQALPEFSALSTRPATVAGQESIEKVFTFVQASVKVQQKQYFFAHGGWYYAMTFSAQSASCEDHEELFERIAANVTFTT